MAATYRLRLTWNDGDCVVDSRMHAKPLLLKIEEYPEGWVRIRATDKTDTYVRCSTITEVEEVPLATACDHTMHQVVTLRYTDTFDGSRVDDLVLAVAPFEEPGAGQYTLRAELLDGTFLHVPVKSVSLWRADVGFGGDSWSPRSPDDEIVSIDLSGSSGGVSNTLQDIDGVVFLNVAESPTRKAFDE